MHNPLLCPVHIFVTHLQQASFIEQGRRMQRETEAQSSLWQLHVCLYSCNPPSQPDKQEPVHGFWKEGDCHLPWSEYFLLYSSASL